MTGTPEQRPDPTPFPPEYLAHLTGHVAVETIQLPGCQFCARVWHFRRPDERAAYATRRLVYGRGEQDGRDADA